MIEVKLDFELTSKQKEIKKVFHKQNLILNGCAGVGKTYLALYLSLLAIKDKKFDKILIVRSPTQTVDVGYLPGGIDLKNNDGGKLAPFIVPYQNIVDELCGKSTWHKLFGKKILFESAIAIRGLTFSDTIVIVDECQNFNFHGLDSIITRLGRNSKFILCGDYYQSDLVKTKDKNGILKFLDILENVPYFHTTNFTRHDIVRGDLVKQYIIAKEDYHKKFN